MPPWGAPRRGSRRGQKGARQQEDVMMTGTDYPDLKITEDEDSDGSEYIPEGQPVKSKSSGLNARSTRDEDQEQDGEPKAKRSRGSRTLRIDGAEIPNIIGPYAPPSTKRANATRSTTTRALTNQPAASTSGTETVGEAVTPDAHAEVAPANSRAKSPARKSKKASAPTSNGTVQSDQASAYYDLEDNLVDNKNFQHGIDGWNGMLPPLYNPEEMFEWLLHQSRSDVLRGITGEGDSDGENFSDVLEYLGGRCLIVGTMCSGSEAPIQGIQQIQRVLARDPSGPVLNYEQAFAADIHPAKAAFIERNSSPAVIYRDVTEFISQTDTTKPCIVTTTYGSKVEVNGQVDLLIAGFACDDFSSLNNHRKILEEKGESGDTFHGILSYIKRFKPCLVVLENVLGAPWLHSKTQGKTKKDPKTKDEYQQFGIDHHLKRAGYYTFLQIVDTKDFALPHTRRRGYMAAVRRDCVPQEWKDPGSDNPCSDEEPLLDGELPNDNTNIQVQFNKLARVIKSFMRPASIPVEGILLAEDHPLLAPRLDGSFGDSIKRAATAWVKCKVGHEDYREENLLGSARPITEWRSDGSRLLPEHYKPFAGMTERVLDSIDIAHLRNLRRFVDDRYYSRLLELSQNVFRVTDITKQGLIGCCMPNNMLFSTLYGRRLTGIEALMLQGVSARFSEFNNMSEGLLHDLAGNAMTSTVVTAINLAVLIVFFPCISLAKRRIQPPDPEPTTKFQGTDTLRAKEVLPASYIGGSVRKVIRLASLTRKLCCCEKQEDVAARQILECLSCGHTACEKCGKKPAHDYRLLGEEELRQRLDPVKFLDFIKARIPNLINLSSLLTNEVRQYIQQLSQQKPDGFDAKDWKAIVTKIQSALLSKVAIREVHRSWDWTITYDSEHAVVKLIISSDSIEWLVYANAVRDPLKGSIGKFLAKFPIMRMQPSGDNIEDDILKGSWQIWNPTLRTFKGHLTLRGRLIPSYEATQGLVRLQNTFVHESMILKIDGGDNPKYFPRNLQGEYVAAPSCGQSFDSFHRRISKTTEEPSLGMFVDTPLGEGRPHDALFVISSDVERKGFQEYRQSYAEIPRFRKPLIEAVEEEGILDPVIGESRIPVEDFRNERHEHVEVIVHGFWLPIEGPYFDRSFGRPFKYRFMPSDGSHAHVDSCDTYFLVFECDAQLPYQTPSKFLKNKWHAVDKVNEEDVWNEFKWAISKQTETLGHREANNSWTFLPTTTSTCISCAPAPPSLKWTFKEKAQSMKWFPWEDPEQATEFEKAMKSRPEAMTVVMHLGDANTFKMKVAVNPMALAHRARALLVGHGEVPGITLSWRLVTDDGKSRKAKLLPFVIKSNSNMLEASQPFASFAVKGQAPTLYSEQQRVLSWMLQQEREPKTFLEEEICESRVCAIGYRLEGRATMPKTVAGGILAQAVGFGKTVVTLGLIAETMKPAKERTKKAINTNEFKLIPTEATLIIVPTHLVSQWQSEVEKFLPSLCKKGAKHVLVIQNVGKLKKLTIQNIKESRIVIVSSNLFTNPTYIELLAQFAGMIPPLQSSSARSKRAWREDTVKRIQENLQVLKSAPETFEELLTEKYRASIKEARGVDVRVPSKHITGNSYMLAKMKKDSAKSKPKPTTLPVSDFKPLFNFEVLEDSHLDLLPLIECFHWYRIVLDEYTYSSDELCPFIELSSAFNRWILSGTPRLGGFDDVKAMASLIGVNLGVDDYSFMAEHVRKAKEAEKTLVERFRAAQEVSSPAYRLHRHRRAQLFLDMFMRQDKAHVLEAKLIEKYCLIQQKPSELAIYAELQQVLAATNFVFAKTKATHSDRDKYIQDAVSCGDAKQALFVRASHFAVKVAAANVNADDWINASQMCQKIKAARDADFQAALEVFKRELKKGEWLQREKERGEECFQFENWKSRVESNQFGDLEVTKSLNDLIKEAESNYDQEDFFDFFYPETAIEEEKKGRQALPIGLIKNSGKKPISRVVNSLRTTSSKINHLTEDLIARKQALRYFECILRIQNKKLFQCAQCKQESKQPNGFTLLTQCGHLVCDRCPVNEATGKCPKNGCSAVNLAYQQTPASYYVGPKMRDNSVYGSKLDKIIEEIKSLTARKQKVIIFSQFDKLEEKLKEALVANNIPFADLANKKNAASILQDFKDDDKPVRNEDNENERGQVEDQTDEMEAEQPEEDDEEESDEEGDSRVGQKRKRKADPKKKSKTKPAKLSLKTMVLFLNPGNETSAGSNITSVRHLIFIHPVYTVGSNAQDLYHSAKTQSIGRSYRYGQKEDVTVYNFVTTQTIEVDYLRAREGKILQSRPGHAHEGELVARIADEAGEFESSTSHLITFDGVSTS